MDARSLMFEIGEHVTGWGRAVRDADGEWFDLPGPETPEFLGPVRPRSMRAVRLVGADFEAVPTEFGPNNAIPECVTITGIWIGDGIRVTRQSPDGQPRRPWPMPVATSTLWPEPELDAAHAMLRARWDDWLLAGISGPMRDREHPAFEVYLDRVTTDLAAWANGLPDGFLALVPSLVPASDR